MAKKVNYCSHIREGQARQYLRVSGPQYDVIICWKCQQDSGQYLAQVQDLVSELKKLVHPEKQTDTTNAPTEIFRRGDQVLLTYNDHTVSAIVSKAAEHGRSFLLSFDGLLGDYSGALVVEWKDSRFVDAIHETEVLITRVCDHID
jgi:hypothetical protein